MLFIIQLYTAISNFLFQTKYLESTKEEINKTLLQIQRYIKIMNHAKDQWPLGLTGDSNQRKTLLSFV